MGGKAQPLEKLYVLRNLGIYCKKENSEVVSLFGAPLLRNVGAFQDESVVRSPA